MMWFLFLSQIRHMFVQVHDKISAIQWYWLFRRVVTIDLHRRSVSGCTHETFYIAVCSSDEQPLLFGFSKSQTEPMQVLLFFKVCCVFGFPRLCQRPTFWRRFISSVMCGNVWHLILAVSHQGWRRPSFRLLPRLNPRHFPLIFLNNQCCQYICWFTLWIGFCWAPAHAKASPWMKSLMRTLSAKAADRMQLHRTYEIELGFGQ